MIEALKDGTIDCVASDHAPHASHEKQVEFNAAPNGSVGLETLFPLVVTHLVRPGHLTLPQALALITHRPAECLRIPGGTLARGAAADLVLFDPEAEWIVHPDDLHSKSRNSAFIGCTVYGRVRHTLVDGTRVTAAPWRPSMKTLRIAVATIALALMGCAYFNTLYNARQKFHDAEKATAAREAQEATRATQVGQSGSVAAPGGAANPSTSTRNPQEADYEAVIEKCRTVMARYPKSRYVDDAMLLIARSLYGLERYDEATAALDSLESRFPKTNLLGDAHFLKGKCLAAAKHYDVAADVLSEYVDHYRKDHDRAEGFYLLCTSQMELGLSDKAVATLHRLEKDHGRSDYRFRAQVEMAGILADKRPLQGKPRRLPAPHRDAHPREHALRRVARHGEVAGSECREYEGALVTLGQIRTLSLGPDQEAPVLILMTAKRASRAPIPRERAIGEYRARGAPSSTAAIRRRGGLPPRRRSTRAMDSLETAQSLLPEGADGLHRFRVRRRGDHVAAPDIGRMLRSSAVAGDDSPEAVALRTFSMAEVQLLQFNNTEKAITKYEKIVNEFGDERIRPQGGVRARLYLRRGNERHHEGARVVRSAAHALSEFAANAARVRVLPGCAPRAAAVVDDALQQAEGGRGGHQTAGREPRRPADRPSRPRRRPRRSRRCRTRCAIRTNCGSPRRRIRRDDGGRSRVHARARARTRRAGRRQRVAQPSLLSAASPAPREFRRADGRSVSARRGTRGSGRRALLPAPPLQHPRLYERARRAW